MADEQKRERFVRWQNLTIVEMGKTINIFLGILFATLGFTISQLIRPEFVFLCDFSNISIIFGTALLFVSIVLFLLTVWNRQNDLRFTTKLTYEKWKNPGSNTVKEFRDLTKEYGDCTHFLFKWGLITAGLSEFLIMLGFSIKVIEY